VTPSPTRAPFVVAAAVAAVPLLVLAAAAPGGNDWRWLELPRHITLLALATGLVIAFRKNRTLPVMVPIVVVALALAWELVGEYLALRKFGRTDLLGQELDLLFSNSVERLAPWLTGTLYGILAYLAIARSRHARTNLVRAGVWLVSVGAVAVALTLANESWLTLENLGQRGTFRSSVAWPDTKKLSLVAAALAITAGLAAVVVGRRRPSPIPPARVVS
jgi:hypothetical protein